MLALSLILLGCGRVTTDTGTSSTTTSTGVQCTIPDPELGTVVEVSWTTATAGVSYVESALDGADGVATPITTESTLSHSIRVLGLKPNREYTLTAVTIDEAGETIEAGSCELETEIAPAELPGFTVTAHDPARVEPGFVMISSIGEDDWVIILDRDGDPVWWVRGESEASIATSGPGADGASVVFTHAAKTQDEDLGAIVRVPLDGSEKTTTRAVMAHHDFADLGDGRYAYLRVGFDYKDHPASAVDSLVEVDEGSTSEEVEDAQIDFDYAVDYSRDPCRHTHPKAYGTKDDDCTHANSLIYEDAEDVFYMMAKNLDHILKIERSTGSVLWELGGTESDFKMSNDARWSHGHYSHMWDGGACIFDNRYHDVKTGDNGESRIIEIAFDETAMTAELVWSWSPGDGTFIPLLGDCRKLAGGTYLTAWTSIGVLREIEPGGDVVWQAEVDLGNGVGRVYHLPSLYTID